MGRPGRINPNICTYTCYGDYTQTHQFLVYYLYSLNHEEAAKLLFLFRLYVTGYYAMWICDVLIQFSLTWYYYWILKTCLIDYFVFRKWCSLSFPRRVFVPWLGDTYICDYIQPSETLEVCICYIPFKRSICSILVSVNLNSHCMASK